MQCNWYPHATIILSFFKKTAKESNIQEWPQYNRKSSLKLSFQNKKKLRKIVSQYNFPIEKSLKFKHFQLYRYREIKILTIHHRNDRMPGFQRKNRPRFRAKFALLQLNCLLHLPIRIEGGLWFIRLPFHKHSPVMVRFKCIDRRLLLQGVRSLIKTFPVYRGRRVVGGSRAYRHTILVVCFHSFMAENADDL